jgi:AhpD family alkylhydroperoxidase
VYSAAKAAVRSLARTLSADLLPRGIRVNAVSPGPIATPIFSRMGLPKDATDALAQSILAQVPMKRFGDPVEVVNAVAFFASRPTSPAGSSALAVVLATSELCNKSQANIQGENMSRIKPIELAQSSGKAKQLLDGVQAKLGMTANMMKTMAQSPAVLEAYLNFAGALGRGALDAKVREQIALVVGQTNGCEYCVAAHTTLGKGAGLDIEEIESSRRAHSANLKASVGLEFAKRFVNQRAVVSEEDLALAPRDIATARSSKSWRMLPSTS